MSRKKMVSQEQIDKENLERRLEDCRYQFLNDPTILYAVGEEVVWGNHKQTTIVEVIDGGKIYKVHVVSTDNNYGNSYDVESDNYVTWKDIKPIPDMKSTVYSYRDDIWLNFSQCSVNSLLCYYYHSGINMNPDYQRGNVWTNDDKVLLIDSIFNNVDIGKFVLIYLPYKDGKHPQYEVLDGKQRITALVEFYENRYSYKGKTFYQLHPRDQSHFENYHISFARTENPMTQEQKYNYFLKLNIGGKTQDPNHIKYVHELLERENSKHKP